MGDKVAVRVYNDARKKWTTGKVHEVLGPRNLIVSTGGILVKRHANQTRLVGPNVCLEDPKILLAFDPPGKSTKVTTAMEPANARPYPMYTRTRENRNDAHASDPRRSERKTKANHLKDMDLYN